jgi:hypothetical protein
LKGRKKRERRTSKENFFLSFYLKNSKKWPPWDFSYFDTSKAEDEKLGRQFYLAGNLTESVKRN